jgi:transcriptional regulator with XRE-family HTH domain
MTGGLRFSGPLLRWERVKRGLSQNELARMSGIAQNTISYIESGLRSPHGSTLRLLAGALKVDVAHFYEEDGGSGDTAA